MDKLIKFFGGMDAVFIVWVIVSSLIAGNIPFYTSFIADIGSSSSFSSWAFILTFMAHLLKVSVFVSAYRLIRVNRIGVYLSLVQAPFRLLVIIPPTFFFLGHLKNSFSSLAMIVVILILGLEVLKVGFQIFWLRKNANISSVPINC